MYIVLLCITVWSVPRPIADSNIRVENEPRLTNLWVSHIKDIKGPHSANLQTKKAIADVVIVSITNIFYSVDNHALFCITLRSIPRPIADSNIRVEDKPRLKNLWVRNRPRAVAEVGRASFGTGEQTVGLTELVSAPSQWVKSACLC